MRMSKHERAIRAELEAAQGAATALQDKLSTMLVEEKALVERCQLLERLLEAGNDDGAGQGE